MSKVGSFWVESQASLIAMIHSCCDYLCPAYPVAFVHLALLHLSCMLWMGRRRQWCGDFGLRRSATTLQRTHFRFTQVWARCSAQPQWIIMFTSSRLRLFVRRNGEHRHSRRQCIAKRRDLLFVERWMEWGRIEKNKKNIIIECSGCFCRRLRVDGSSSEIGKFH